MSRDDEGVLEMFEGWLSHHYQRSDGAEETFRKAAGEMRDDLEANIDTVLERHG